MIKTFKTPSEFSRFLDDCAALHAGGGIKVEREYEGWAKVRKGWKAFRVVILIRSKVGCTAPLPGCEKKAFHCRVKQ